jgi:acetyl esterase/lipase
MTTNGSGSGSSERDIVFGTGGARDLKLDLHRPAPAASKRTAIIHLHGGGFRGGSKEATERSAKYYVARGYVCIASQYRLADEAKWPAQIEDVKAAIRWTRANAASLDIDPDKIVVAGYSAGGHLALTAAGSADVPELEGAGGNPGLSTRVAACIAYYPNAMTRPPAAGGDALLMVPGSSMDAYRRASPISYVGPGSPPTLFFHSTGDTTIPFEVSRLTFDVLRSFGVPAELHVLEGLSHVFDRHEEFAEACAAMGDLFLDRHVVQPREYPPFQAGAPATPAAAR